MLQDCDKDDLGVAVVLNTLRELVAGNIKASYGGGGGGGYKKRSSFMLLGRKSTEGPAPDTGRRSIDGERVHEDLASQCPVSCTYKICPPLT